MRKDGWEPCPRCGGNRVEQSGPIQKAFLMALIAGAMFIFGALTIPFLVGIPILIIAPFVLIFSFVMFFTGKTNTCKDCNYHWDAKKNKKPKKVKKNEEYKGFIR